MHTVKMAVNGVGSSQYLRIYIFIIIIVIIVVYERDSRCENISRCHVRSFRAHRWILIAIISFCGYAQYNPVERCI